MVAAMRLKTAFFKLDQHLGVKRESVKMEYRAALTECNQS